MVNRVKNIKMAALQSSKTKQIIVAKYKENVSWLNEIKNVPIRVYDKYDKQATDHLPNIPSFPVQLFEGVKYAKSPTGRESHTYLYHIIKNYDNLADINIFLQGNPTEMNFDSRNALKLHFETDFEGVNFLPLNFPLVICDKQAAPLHRGLPLERVFKRLFQGPCPDLFAFSWGAMFCVSKEYILNRPLVFYEEMMQIIYEEPLSGYVYERLWPAILACHGFLPHPTYSKKNRADWNMPNL